MSGLTTLSHFTDVHSLFCSHEAQSREHNETSKKTGSTVDKSQDKRIPAGKRQKNPKNNYTKKKKTVGKICQSI